MGAVRALFIKHGAEGAPEGRSLRLLREWLSPTQREQFATKGHFEVVGSDSGKRYRIHAGASANVCELDEGGRLKAGLCFMPTGALPGDVMLAQKRLRNRNASRPALGSVDTYLSCGRLTAGAGRSITSVRER